MAKNKIINDFILPYLKKELEKDVIVEPKNKKTKDWQIFILKKFIIEYIIKK